VAAIVRGMPQPRLPRSQVPRPPSYYCPVTGVNFLLLLESCAFVPFNRKRDPLHLAVEYSDVAGGCVHVRIALQKF
jgi:hypothetical protein